MRLYTELLNVEQNPEEGAITILDCITLSTSNFGTWKLEAESTDSEYNAEDKSLGARWKGVDFVSMDTVVVEGEIKIAQGTIFSNTDFEKLLKNIFDVSLQKFLEDIIDINLGLDAGESPALKVENLTLATDNSWDFTLSDFGTGEITVN